MDRRSSPERVIPVTVVAGYLGSGKTTLINRILTGGHGLRLTVVVNDFGEVNVDAGLIESHDGDTLALTNGCVCCSIGEDLGSTLAEITGAARPPDAIVIEASGVAEPGRLTAFVGANNGTALRAVAVVADAETVRTQSRDKYVGDLVMGQLGAADLIVLNKADLVRGPELAAIREWVRVVGGGVAVIAAVSGEVPVDLLVGGVSLSRVVTDSNEAPSSGLAGDRFTSFVVEAHRDWDQSRLGEVLDGLPSSVVRIKGKVALTDGPRTQYWLQLVGRRWTVEQVLVRDSGEADGRGTRLVVIVVDDGTDAESVVRRSFGTL